jgi:predicted secreted protein
VVPAPSVLTFTAADASHPLSVHVQHPFQIFLVDCGSDGGYAWTVVITSPTLLTQVGEVTRHSSSDLPGAGADYTFHFLALANGQTTLTFNCARSWEVNTPLSQVVTFTFNITATGSEGATSYSPVPMGDGCLVGSWSLQNKTVKWLVSAKPLGAPLVGLQGAKMTITPEGTQTINYDSSQPWNSTSESQTTYRGVITFHFHANANVLTFAEEGSSQVTVTDTSNSSATSTDTLPSTPEFSTMTYTCNAKELGMLGQVHLSDNPTTVIQTAYTYTRTA